MTISDDSRARIKKIFEPVALGMGRLGLTPDALTLIGFGITVVGALLLATQQWLLGGIVVFAGGVFDMFDGTLARATGRVSKLGAFMDSVFDKMGEIVVYLGIVIGCLNGGFADGVVVAVAAMGAAVMVSYTRARSEGLGFTSGTGMAAIGIMPREVRLVALSLALVATGIAGGVEVPGLLYRFGIDLPGGLFLDLKAGRGFIALALSIITIGSTITTIQRILHVRSQATSNGETAT